MFTINNEVWVNELYVKNRGIVGKLVEIKGEHCTIETIQGKRIAGDREKVRPIAELYGVK